jgi:hypothetical protein
MIAIDDTFIENKLIIKRSYNPLRHSFEIVRWRDESILLVSLFEWSNLRYRNTAHLRSAGKIYDGPFEIGQIIER